MIPDEKKAAVKRALQETFEVGEFEDIQLLAAGVSSALVFRIAVGGRPYVMRVCTRTDGRNDPTRQYACMKIAADAGLAPRVWYTNVADRISIIDFVEPRALTVQDAVVPVAATLRKLHLLHGFANLENDFDTAPTFLLRSSKMQDEFLERFRKSQILPEEDTNELLALHGRVKRTYLWQEADLVASHNDLKPANMIFDGRGLWLIDWEAAFLNDRYNDLAVMANFVVADDAEEEIYLRTYFGEAAGEHRSARLYRMRQLVHLFYAMVFLLLGSAGRPIDLSAPVPAFRDLHGGIWAGRIALDSNEHKVQFGRAHMKQVLQNSRTERFLNMVRN